MAPFDRKYITSTQLARAMFALSLTVCEIFGKQEKCQNCGVENEGQDQRVEERDLRHSIRLKMFESI